VHSVTVSASGRIWGTGVWAASGN